VCHRVLNTPIVKWCSDFVRLHFNRKLIDKGDEVSRVYFSKLRKELTEFGINSVEVNSVIEDLKVDNDRIIERAYLLVFYRLWKDRKYKLTDAAGRVKKNYFKTSSLDESNTKVGDVQNQSILRHSIHDLIDMLCREVNEPSQYIGLDSFIEMSEGIPRHLLIILKHIYRWANFNGEEPFKVGVKISQDAQVKGLKEAAEWFFEDASLTGVTGKRIDTSIRRLANYLREIRLSQTPPQPSITSFRVDIASIEPETLEVLNYLQAYSYLIRGKDRRVRQGNRKDAVYQVNGLLAQYFELSIFKNGVIDVSKQEAQLIFTDQEKEQYDKFVSREKAKYNPPFQQQSAPLFKEK